MTPESIDAFFKGLGQILTIVVPVALAYFAYRQNQQGNQLSKVQKQTDGLAAAAGLAGEEKGEARAMAATAAQALADAQLAAKIATAVAAAVASVQPAGLPTAAPVIPVAPPPPVV